MIPKNERDYFALEALANEYVQSIENGKYVDEDLKHYIFESAIETLYGQNVWDWVRNKQ